MAESEDALPDAPDGAVEEAPAKSGSLKKMLLILLPMLLLGVGGGGYLAYSQYGRLSQAAQALGIGAEEEGDEEEGAIEYGEFMQIENVIVNPAGTQGRRFLMVTIGLESNDAAVLEEVKTKEVVVRDTLLKLLSTRSVDELAAIEERATIKQQLREAVNGVTREGGVDRLYFTKYVLQ